jgi:fluoroacetyl-CoA thioesterase
MEIKIAPGLSLSTEKIVEKEDTAAHYGSGLVEVFATPAMVAMMENTALQIVLPHLPEGYNTVGTEICVRHLKATPVNMKVRCEAKLIQVEGRKLVFSVVAWDEENMIGEGTHTRFIINTESFIQRLAGKP